MTALPPPSPDAQAASAALCRQIAAEIASQGGWISFARYMERALYAPGLGYYAGGAHKFGAAGDFVTAPELSPLFAQTLAAQAAQVMGCSAPHIIEVGAGSGRLAADLLLELEARGTLPESYAILDLSGELRARQQATLAERAPQLAARVRWLERLPEHFDGLVLANELLDALPVHLVVWGSEAEPETIFERGVAVEDDRLVWQDRPATGRLAERAHALAAEHPMPTGYLSEISLAAGDWTASWAPILGRGALRPMRSGLPPHAFFLPPRRDRPLMCRLAERAHAAPFY